MFDMRQLTPRYFEVRLPNGLRLEVEPPKVKILKSVTDLAKIDKSSILEENDLIDRLADAISKSMSKNRQGKKISPDLILDIMNIDEMMDLLRAYFEWVGEIRNSKN